MILYGGRSESKCQVLYRNVYSTTYVGHMQTNKLTTLWQPQVPHSCVCNSNTNYINSNCKQKNDTQKISAGGSQPTRTQFLSLEMPAAGTPGRTQQTQLKPCAKTSDWRPPSVMPHRPRGRCRKLTSVRDARETTSLMEVNGWKLSIQERWPSWRQPWMTFAFRSCVKI